MEVNKNNMQQNNDYEFCRTFACVFMFLLTFNDFSFVNFDKITLIFGKHFKMLTNTISRLRLCDSKCIVTSPSAQ